MRDGENIFISYVYTCETCGEHYTLPELVDGHCSCGNVCRIDERWLNIEHDGNSYVYHVPVSSIK